MTEPPTETRHVTMRIGVHVLRSAVVVGVLACGPGDASTHSVTASASFDIPLTLVSDADISFGVLQALTSGTYVIDTNGTVTTSDGGVALGGAHKQGQITISGSSAQSLVISTGSYIADHGVTPSAATCNYDGSPIADCDAGAASLAAPGSAGKVLKLGVTISADGTQAAGSTATPSFVVNVVYN